MKTGWVVRPLGDLLEIQNGFAFESKRFSSDSGMPLIRIRDLKNGYTTETNYNGDYDERFVVSAGDLLIGMDGEFRCYEWVGDDALLNQRVCRLQNFHATLEPRFVLYGVNTYLQEIEDATGFTTVKHLSAKRILGIEFPVPPIAEQRRIVAILDKAFEGIAAAKANAERNLRNAKEVFGSRLNEVFQQAYARGVTQLAALATDITDGDHLPPPKSPQGVPFITIGNIDKTSGTIDFGETFKVPRTYFDELKSNRRPRKGDVLYTVTGSYGIPVLIDFDKEFCFQRHIALVRPSEAADSEWLAFLLQSPQVMRQASEKATGTAQKTVSLKTLRTFDVPTVPLPQQRSDARGLADTHRQVRAMEEQYARKSNSLDELKASVLHQAFTGQL